MGKVISIRLQAAEKVVYQIKERRIWENVPWRRRNSETDTNNLLDNIRYYSKTQINQIEHSSGPKGGDVGDMLDELERASLEAGRDRSCLLLFRKIYCGAVQ